MKGEKTQVTRVERKIKNLLRDLDKRINTKGTNEYYLVKAMDDLRLPINWSMYRKSDSVASLQLESLNSTEPLHKIEDVDAETFSAIKTLVASGLRNELIGHGRDAKGLNYKNIEVTEVKRIENPKLFEKYAFQRKNYLLRQASNNPLVPLENLGDLKPILTTQHCDSKLLVDMHQEINEHYLYHGTTHAITESIMANGVDVRLSNGAGMFGQGLYCAESLTKADQYVGKSRFSLNPDVIFCFNILQVHAWKGQKIHARWSVKNKRDC